MEKVRYHQQLPAAVDVRSFIASNSGRGIQANLPTAASPSRDSQASPTALLTSQNLPRFSEMETYNGHVRTPADAIILFEACRLGLLPRVQRRLSEKERQSIKSGSVFVWDEREAGMRRWTDGKSWSASRVSGSFLTYREMEGKRGGNNFGPPLAAVSRAGKTPDSGRGSDSDAEMTGEDGPDGYRYKPDGLMKQSFSITTSSGNHLHLISYYSRSHPAASNLNSPTGDPSLRHIRPQKGMYPESTVHEHQNIPAVTRSPMISAPFSTVPQMAGYARQGPPQWSPHYNGYGWAPPAMSQSQAPQYNYQYAEGQYVNGPPPPPPPPNGNYSSAQLSHTNGHSPFSQPHAMQQNPSLHFQDPQTVRFSSMSGPPPSYGYDARNGSPMAPQQQHYSDNFRPAFDQNTPPFDPRYSSNQFRNTAPLPDNLASRSQQQNRAAYSTNGMQHPLYQHQPKQQQYQTHTQTSSPHLLQNPPTAPPQYHQPSVTGSTPIDPRLFAPPMMSQQYQIKPESRNSTPAMVAQEQMDASTSHTNGVTQASTIPSIGSIMNGTPVDSNNSPNADAKSDQSGERTPGGSAKKESRPQDIPSDKLGFGEDMRALKVLDRAFRT